MAVSTVLRQSDEDRCWSLYLSVVANPFVEQQSFGEFLERMRGPVNGIDRGEELRAETGGRQGTMLVAHAKKVLEGFVPPTEGGK